MNKQHRQTGASLVEMSLTITVFLVLVLAIVEFSMLVFLWARAVEATRAGVRHAVVNTPVVNLAGLACPGSGVISARCSEVDCAGMLATMQAVLPELDAAQVTVSYRCSGTGNPIRPDAMLVPVVAVAISDMQFRFMTAGLFGLEGSVGMPDFEAVRTGEDMFTTAAD
ncbi:MAG TPA: TadE family protein [Pseudomonadales bacterium]